MSLKCKTPLGDDFPIGNRLFVRNYLASISQCYVNCRSENYNYSVITQLNFQRCNNLNSTAKRAVSFEGTFFETPCMFSICSLLSLLRRPCWRFFLDVCLQQYTPGASITTLKLFAEYDCLDYCTSILLWLYVDFGYCTAKLDDLYRLSNAITLGLELTCNRMTNRTEYYH